MIKKHKNKLILLLILIIFISAFFYIKDRDLAVDEPAHHEQITKFMNKDFTLINHLTTIPGYHAFFALLTSALHISPKVSSIRLLSSIFSLISIFIFYILSSKIEKDKAKIKTLQYYFFPILFPFFFLIYTDVFSVLLVLISFYFLLKNKYDYAGLFGILSFLVRQNNVVWMVFMCGIIYYKNFGFKIKFEYIKIFLNNCIVFIMGFFIFLIFVIVNKGVSLGVQWVHPSFSLHMGNIYFILFLFFFLFLPLNISNFFKIIEFSKKNKKIIVAILCLFIFYMLTFVNNHIFNTMGGDHFLRNKALIYFTSSLLLKAIFFLPIAYSILSLFVTKLKDKSFYLLYPFTALYLMPSWLIEQRYYLIPFALFILFKKEKTKLIEYSTIILYIILSIAIFYWIKNNIFFP